MAYGTRPIGERRSQIDALSFRTPTRTFYRAVACVIPAEEADVCGPNCSRKDTRTGAAPLGPLKGDVNLPVDIRRRYSLIVLALSYAPAADLGNGRSPGKGSDGIRVVSLNHEPIAW